MFDLPPGQPGLLFMGAARREVLFGDGQLCVAAGGKGIFRFPVQVAGADTSVHYGPGLVAFSQSHFPPSGHVLPATAGTCSTRTAIPADPAGAAGTPSTRSP